MPLAKDVDLNVLADQTNGYVGSDIEAIVREAAMLSIRENLKTKEVRLSHFNEALKKVYPSVTEGDLKRYKEIEDTYLRSARGITIKSETNYFG